MREVKGKIGQFFALLGLVSLVIFFTTAQARHPGYGFFFAGFALLFLGIYMIWRGYKPPPEAERFRTVRSFRNKFRHRGEQPDKKDRQSRQ